METKPSRYNCTIWKVLSQGRKATQKKKQSEGWCFPGIVTLLGLSGFLYYGHAFLYENKKEFKNSASKILANAKLLSHITNPN